MNCLKILGDKKSGALSISLSLLVINSLIQLAFVSVHTHICFLTPHSPPRRWSPWLRPVDSGKEEWCRVCVIWCLTWDMGSLSPLCALTDHITISESYSVRRRSYDPAEEQPQGETGIQWQGVSFRGGDLRWLDTKGPCCLVQFFVLTKSCFLPTKLSFASVLFNVVIW